MTLDLAPPSTATTHPAVSDAPRGPAAVRLFFADHLRVALTALVVIHHLTIAFAIPLPGSWYLEDATQNPAANVVGLLIVLIDQAFFMGAFFCLAGTFTSGAYDRKGPGGFLRDRAIRLLIPLVVFDILLGPLASLPAALATHTPITLETYLTNLDHPGPLWFVEVLFLLSCAYAAVRVIRRRAPEAGSVTAAPPRTSLIVGFTLVLAAVSFLFRIVVPIGLTLPVLQLPTPAYLPQYAGLFIAGVVAGRRGWFRTIPDRAGWIGLAVSAVATVVLFLPALGTSLHSDAFEGGLHWQAAAYALWDSTLSVGMFLGLLVIFRRWVNRPGRLWNELSRNAFGVYVMHAPLVVGLSLLLFGLPVTPLLKLLIAVVIALPLCFTVAGLVRRLPGARRVL